MIRKNQCKFVHAKLDMNNNPMGQKNEMKDTKWKCGWACNGHNRPNETGLIKTLREGSMQPPRELATGN